MTLRARVVLADCESLIADLKAEPSASWRLRWAGFVSLLRAVGHVLDNVDGEESPEARKAIDEAWASLKKSKPEPRIFHEFIEEERNNVLKAYQFGAAVNISVHVGTVHLNLKTGEQTSTPGKPTTFNAFMRSGPYAGQDPLDLAREAIGFWRDFLDSVDSRIAQLKE